MTQTTQTTERYAGSTPPSLHYLVIRPILVVVSLINMGRIALNLKAHNAHNMYHAHGKQLGELY